MCGTAVATRLLTRFLAKANALIDVFTIMECADILDVTRWANQLPTDGSVEVRPLIEYDLS